MDAYDELTHNMETSWNSMCKSEHDRDTSTIIRVTQGFNTPGQGKLDGAYLCLCHASRVGTPRPYPHSNDTE
jgi:hypothetical protein